MTAIIITIALIGYILIATEYLTNINKAAVAIFLGAVGWVLYICYGTDFVMGQHPAEYGNFLQGASPTSLNVKQFISQNIFLKYVGKASEVVLFLTATMSIVEILMNNGCFDFVLHIMRTRNSQRLLWILAIVTLLISVNIDNLTTTVMMLFMMHKIVVSRRQRMIYGSAIVLSANIGGAITVIGDPIGLVLWNNGYVDATNFSMSLILPCFIAWALPIFLIGRTLPDTVDRECVTLPYRGDDTRLNVWQRLLMLFVGIGGLWFIPTFHTITRLSPFLGALCVLSVLWIVNEVVNRKLLPTNEYINRQMPHMLRYGVIQLMLFVMGIMLFLGVLAETGFAATAAAFIQESIGNIWIIGALAGMLSTVLNNIASTLTAITLCVPTASASIATAPLDYASAFMQNGAFWKMIAYTTTIGSNILGIGSIAGLAYIKVERVRISWYLRNIGVKCLIGGLLGFIVLILTETL